MEPKTPRFEIASGDGFAGAVGACQADDHSRGVKWGGGSRSFDREEARFPSGRQGKGLSILAVRVALNKQFTFKPGDPLVELLAEGGLIAEIAPL